MSDATGDRPPLRVVRGEPTAEELAAVAAVVTAAATSADDRLAPAPLRGRWNDPAAMHQQPVFAGPGGWRAAAR